MGHLKDISNQPKLQTFPSSTFEISGDVPAAQCSEAQVEGNHGQTGPGGNALADPGKFTGWVLNGKALHITAPPANVGTYDINNNTNDVIITVQIIPAASADNVYYVTNGGLLILTRDVQSFAEFIDAAGYAYTIKGGKLYTNIPSAQLQNACTILFDPLT